MSLNGGPKKDEMAIEHLRRSLSLIGKGNGPGSALLPQSQPDSLLLKPDETPSPVRLVPRTDLVRITAPEIGGVGHYLYNREMWDVQDFNPDMRSGKGLDIFEKMRSTDGEVYASLQRLKAPLLSANWEVRPSDPELGVVGAEEHADLVRDVLFNNRHTGPMGDSWTDTLRHALLMLDFGFSAFEKVWGVDDKGRQVILRLAPRMPRTFFKFTFTPDGSLESATQRAWTVTEGFKEATIPGPKLVIAVFGREGMNYFGRSILRSAYVHWYHKRALIELDGIDKERNAVGVAWIQPNEAAMSAEDKAAAEKVVRELRAHERQGLFIPHGFTFEVAYPTGTRADIISSIKYHDTQISRCMMAEFMALGASESGSRAVAGEKIDFLKVALQGVARVLEETFTRQIAEDLVIRNFGTQVGYPSVHIEDMDNMGGEQLAPILKQFVDAQLIKPDEPLRKYVRKLMDLPDEDPLTAESPPPPMQPGVGGAPGMPPGAGGPAPFEQKPDGLPGNVPPGGDKTAPPSEEKEPKSKPPWLAFDPSQPRADDGKWTDGGGGNGGNSEADEHNRRVAEHRAALKAARNERGPKPKRLKRNDVVTGHMPTAPFQLPNGKFAITGTVPPELLYVGTPEQIAKAVRLGPIYADVKTRAWDTKAEAQAAIDEWNATHTEDERLYAEVVPATTRRAPHAHEIYCAFERMESFLDGEPGRIWHRVVKPIRDEQIALLAAKAAGATDAELAAGLATPLRARLAEAIDAELVRAYRRGRMEILVERRRQLAGKPVPGAAMTMADDPDGDPEADGYEDIEEFEDDIDDIRTEPTRQQRSWIRRSAEGVATVMGALLVAEAVKAGMAAKQDELSAERARLRIYEMLRGLSEPRATAQLASAVTRAFTNGRNEQAEAIGTPERAFYSAMMDYDRYGRLQTCEVCEALDGQEHDVDNDAYVTPNPRCLGRLGDNECRCVTIYVWGGGADDGTSDDDPFDDGEVDVAATEPRPRSFMDSVRAMFDPNQPRADDGKWTDGGGGGGGGSKGMSKPRGKDPKWDAYIDSISGGGGNVKGIVKSTTPPRGAKVPKVDWGKGTRPGRFVMDDGVKVYKGWIRVKDAPKEWIHEELWRPSGGQRASDRPKYDWSKFKKGGTFTAATINIDNNGDMSLLDGNHRMRFWRKSGFDYIPARFVDYRTRRATEMIAYDPNQPRDPEGSDTGGQWSSGGSGGGGGSSTTEPHGYGSRPFRKPGESDESFAARKAEYNKKVREYYAKKRAEKSGKPNEPTEPATTPEPPKPEPPPEPKNITERLMSKPMNEWKAVDMQELGSHFIQELDPESTVVARFQDKGSYMGYYWPQNPAGSRHPEEFIDGVTMCPNNYLDFSRERAREMGKSFDDPEVRAAAINGWKGIVAHEFQHAHFNVLQNDYQVEWNRANNEFHSYRGALGDRQWIADTKHRAPLTGEFTAEFASKYPVLAQFADYMEPGGRHYDTLKTEDGVTDYSKTYYMGGRSTSNPNQFGGGGWRSDFNETLSEISRIRVGGIKVGELPAKDTSFEMISQHQYARRYKPEKEIHPLWMELQRNVYRYTTPRRKMRTERMRNEGHPTVEKAELNRDNWNRVKQDDKDWKEFVRKTANESDAPDVIAYMDWFEWTVVDRGDADMAKIAWPDGRVAFVPVIDGELQMDDGPKLAFDPNQPRDPAGSDTGGQWSSGGASGGAGNGASVTERPNFDSPDAMMAYYIPDEQIRRQLEADQADAESRPKTFLDNSPERQQLRRDVIEQAYGQGAINKNREAWIVTGQPASGKSSMVSDPLVAQHGALLIDNDEYKAMFPEFDGGMGASALHDEASLIVQPAVAERAALAGDNIVWPRVGKSYEPLKADIEMLKQMGYKVHLVYTDVPDKIAIQRGVERYRRGVERTGRGRLVSVPYMHSVDGHPKKAFERAESESIADTFTIMSTDVPFGQPAVKVR